MNHRIKQFLVAAAVLGCAHTASAAERNPALDLLVKKGLITAEERAQALEQAAVAKMAEPAKQTPWYEKMKIDGYTQVRHTEQLNAAAYLTGGLPADRSVDPNNSFVVRRARFKFQGDFGRVYLYYQTDAAASVDSGSKRNFGLQTRDIYADIALDEDKEHRIRAGVSKVPFGWVNMQSSQNRLAIERPEALNSAVEGERDQGVYYMYASKEDRALLKKLVKEGYKGSGDYGIFTAGFYSGAGLNRADNNGEVHSIIRYTKPWVAASGQMYEAGLVAYAGRFKVSTADTSTTLRAALETNIDANDPRDLSDGFVDRRAAATFIMYPQPWGIEAEWNVGQSPTLNDARDNITNGQVEGVTSWSTTSTSTVSSPSSSPSSAGATTTAPASSPPTPRSRTLTRSTSASNGSGARKSSSCSPTPSPRNVRTPAPRIRSSSPTRSAPRSSSSSNTKPDPRTGYASRAGRDAGPPPLAESPTSPDLAVRAVSYP